MELFIEFSLLFLFIIKLFKFSFASILALMNFFYWACYW